MSKASDSVERKKLINILGSILTKCELHMMRVLINKVILNVKTGNRTGPEIHLNIGICQGDCLSALLYILYLAFTVKPVTPVISAIDYHKPLWSAHDSIIDRDLHQNYWPRICWWYFIPVIRWVENQSSWKRDICYVAHRRFACKWKQNRKVSHTKRWRRSLEEMQISRITTLHRRRYQKAKRFYNWFIQDLRIYFQQQAC